MCSQTCMLRAQLWLPVMTSLPLYFSIVFHEQILAAFVFLNKLTHLIGHLLLVL